MKYLFFALVVQVTVWQSFLEAANAGKKYRREGKFIIGAIIPLTKKVVGAEECTVPNPLGAAITESIVYALDNINTDTGFGELIKTKGITLGYDIRDSCGDPVKEKRLAYDMSREALDYKGNPSKPMPVRVVISAFPKETVKMLNVLNGENIIQVSYSADNARLKKDQSIAEDNIRGLVSVYPEDTKKIYAIVDLIKKFKFNHVHAVVSDDYQGKAALKLLQSELKAIQVCESNPMFISDKSKVKSVVATIADNPRISVVVVHCTKDIEEAFYQELKSQNVTNLIFLSTQKWKRIFAKGDVPFPAVIEGMVTVEEEKYIKNYKLYLKGSQLTYRNQPWLIDLFKGNGGTDKCLKSTFLRSNNKSETEHCFKAEKTVQKLLLEASRESVYAYDGIYTIVYALQVSKEKGISLLEAMKGLNFRIPLMTRNKIVINDNLAAETAKFKLFNFQGSTKNTSEFKWLGEWDEDVIQGRHLQILQNGIKWKKGSKETPISICSESCRPGYERSFIDENWKCCWTCKKCANTTSSNVTNADKCITCPAGRVPNPTQSSCVKYKLLYFKWFGPVGSFLIVLMVLGVTLVLFALGIISQNNNHEYVMESNYNSLCVFLFALLILILAPIPLLIMPTTASCMSYIALFNVTIALIIGILMSRSAYVNGFFDDNGELTKGCLGGSPRVIIVLLVVLFQIVIMIVGYKLDAPKTLHNGTNKWDERYHECSTWASMTFWCGFAYNVFASVVANSMSCSSTKIEDNCQELKYILLSHINFYMFAIVELCVFFRCVDENLAGGQGILCVIFAFMFYFCYIWPKLYVILFKSRGDKAIEKPLLDNDEDGDMMTTAIHASAGFKNQGIVQMKIRDEV